jgi:hypothetical protein
MVGALLKRRSALFGLWVQSKLILQAIQTEATSAGERQITTIE